MFYIPVHVNMDEIHVLGVFTSEEKALENIKIYQKDHDAEFVTMTTVDELDTLEESNAGLVHKEMVEQLRIMDILKHLECR